jgi:hypothetical protein
VVNTNLALARALTEQREAAAVYHELFHEWPARCYAIMAAPAAEQRATNRVPAPASRRTISACQHGNRSIMSIDAGQRMRVAAHVAEASATLSAVRLNTQRTPRTLEYIRHLEMLDSDLLSITSRLLNVPPQDRDIEADLRGVVNLVHDLNHVELEPVRKDVEAAYNAVLADP